MPRIVFTIKLYHEQKGIPSLIRDVDGPPINGWVVPINNNNGGPFGDSGNKPIKGGGGPP